MDELQKSIIKVKDLLRSGLNSFTDEIEYIMELEKDIIKNRINCLIFENFKNLESIIALIDICAFDQAAIIMRNEWTEISKLKILRDHREVWEEYNDFYTRRLNMLIYKDDDAGKMALEENKQLLKGSNYKMKEHQFADYGWLLKLSDSENICDGDMLDLAGYGKFREYRQSLNKFVHSVVTFKLFNHDAFVYDISELIYITGIMCNHIMNISIELIGQNFVINEIDYYHELVELLKKLDILWPKRKKN